MEIHEVAKIFPLMSGSDLIDLARDIAENGLREDIETHDGKIIDGRNRYNACLQVGVKPTFKEWDHKGSLVSYVLSKNLHRRHMSESQRAMVAAKVANLSEGNPHREELTPSIDGVKVSQDEAAEMLNVSPASVGRAKKIQKKGVPELAEAVERGDVSVAAASHVAEHVEPEKQSEIVKAGPAAIRRESARIQRDQSGKQKRDEKAMKGGTRVQKIWDAISEIHELTKRPNHAYPFLQIKTKVAELVEMFSKAFDLN